MSGNVYFNKLFLPEIQFSAYWSHGCEAFLWPHSIVSFYCSRLFTWMEYKLNQSYRQSCSNYYSRTHHRRVCENVVKEVGHSTIQKQKCLQDLTLLPLLPDISRHILVGGGETRCLCLWHFLGRCSFRLHHSSTWRIQTEGTLYRCLGRSEHDLIASSMVGWVESQRWRVQRLHSGEKLYFDTF